MARVRLFANLREIAGASHVDIEGATVGEVIAALAARYGQGFDRRLETARIWKNGNEATATDPITEGDELAVIPPVSGGADLGIAGSGLESLLLIGLVAILLGANAIDTAVLAALWVGVAALWVIDLAHAASDGDFKIDYQPLLAAILVSMSSSITFGPSGLGVGVAISMVMVMGWAVVRPEARDLTIMASLALCALIASLSVGSILLARASPDGDIKIAGLLIIAVLGALDGAERRAQPRPAGRSIHDGLHRYGAGSTGCGLLCGLRPSRMVLHRIGPGRRHDCRSRYRLGLPDGTDPVGDAPGRFPVGARRPDGGRGRFHAGGVVDILSFRYR